MKIGIISRGPRLYSTRRLKEAALARKHKVTIYDPMGFSMQVETQAPDMYFRGKPVPHIDAMIPRIGASITFFGCAVVRQFEQMGVFMLNSSAGITVSRDKLRSMQIFSRHEIGLPPTAFVRRREDILPAIERVGGAPVIIKLIEGTQGVGVILAETLKVAEAIIETLQGAKQNVLLQKFVAESKGTDIRAFVVGGKVIAAMRRTAVGTEFRSNVHRGGKAQGVDLSPEYERTAVHAAQIMGLHVAGVDMLEGAEGPQIMEVNSSPGLEGIEGASGVDVAGEIIRYLEQQVLFPDVDLRQRLTLSSGYTVAEFPVIEKSNLAGQTLATAQLREREIIVLSIKRGGIVIPAPTGSQELLTGDLLLCYGKRLALSSLIPPPKKKRRSKKKTKKKKATTTAT